MKEDWKKFNLLQKILVVIDLILNPKSYTYPFLYTEIKKDMLEIELPPKHLVIKSFIKDNKIWFWCIRWI